MKLRRTLALGLAVTALGLSAPVTTAQDRPAVLIQSQDLGGGVHMVTGQGGNVGVMIGDDGVFVIDDQFARTIGPILDKIKELTEQPVKFLLNTHWHGDHVGGNETVGKAGAVIVAHANVRERLSADQVVERFGREMKVPALPHVALPVVTFSETMKFHLNGETIHVVHAPAAHTDGDSFVKFEKANVLHTGDLYFNGMYPLIDLSVGGSLKGMISAADLALGHVDDKTQIIPGHGKVSKRAELVAFRDTLSGIREAVKKLIDAGKTKEEVVAAKPTAPWDPKWGKGFIRPDIMAATAFDSISAE